MVKKIIYTTFIFILLCLNTYSSQWILVDDNINYYYDGLECLDSLNAAVLLQAGENAFVKITTDGGMSWITKMQDTGNIHWPDSYEYSFCKVLINGYKAVLDSGDYWESNDRGLSWEHKRYRDSNYKIYGSDIKFFNEERGAILEPQSIFLTSDSCKNWTEIPINMLDTNINSGSLMSLSIPTENTIIILSLNIIKSYVDDSTYIIRSDDFGKTWKSYPVMADHNNRLNNICFIDSLRGWAVGMPKQNTNIRRDVIKYTSDGGYSWKYQLDTIMGKQPGGLFQIKFYDDSNGITIGQWYHMWKTTNAGLNWFVDTSYHSEYTGGEISWYFNHVSYLTRNSILATDASNGGIYKYFDEPVGIPETIQFGDNNIIISPNPASDYIEINLERWSPSSVWTPSEIQIYNSLGECVLSPAGGGVCAADGGGNPISFGKGPGLRLDISALPPGVYFLILRDGKEILTNGFIVLR
jgi:photosystem II stability/assembly factor-like uncharacterized protein